MSHTRFPHSSEIINLELKSYCYLTADLYTTDDLAFCFKLTIWDLQCKYGDLSLEKIVKIYL
jgi:hypothetical protein